MAGRKVNPQGLTSMAFGLCTGGWVILLIMFYLKFIEHKVFFNDVTKYSIIIITLISAGLVNEFYSSNDRYQKVYNEYSSSGFVKNKKRAMLFSFFIIFLPYLILAAFGILLALEG